MAQQSGFTTAGNINYAGITAGTKTLSIFAKAGTFDHIALSYNGVTYFNLTNGTIGTTASGHTAVITDMGDGWYRCAITKTTTGTYTAAYYFAQNNGTLTTTDTQGYMYAYGAMIETGSYPTSYIPTYGSSATRTKDAASLVATDLLDQDNQTLFIEYTKGGIDGSANTIYSTSDGTSSANRMQVVDNNDDVYLYSNAGGTNILNNTNALLLSGLETGDTIKVAVVMTETSIKAFANGVEKVNFTDAFSWSVTMDDLYIGARGGSSEPPKGQGVKQAVVFPTALTDNECKALTRPYDTYQEWVDGEGLTWESKSCTVQNIVELQNL